MKMENEGIGMTNDVKGGENAKDGNMDVERIARESSEEVMKKAGGAKGLENILERSVNGDLEALNELRKLVEWGSARFIEDAQFWKAISGFIEDMPEEEDMTPEYRCALRSLKTAYARLSIHAYLIGFVDMLKRIGGRSDIDNFEKCIDNMFAELNGEVANESCTLSSILANNADA